MNCGAHLLPALAAPLRLPGSDSVMLRPVREDDEPFLYALYAGTRTGEMELVPWTPDQKEEFLRMQYRAQTVHYQAVYPAMEAMIILHHGQPAGRILLAAIEDEYRLVDLALLPEHRGGGIGTLLLEQLKADAERQGRAVRLHVEFFNPARRLYERLGFIPVAHNDVYIRMEWLPPSISSGKGR